MKNNFLNIILLIIIMFCFGSTFLFTFMSLTDFDPLASGSARIIIAGLFSLIFAVVSGHGLPKKKTIWLYSAFYGVFCLSLPFLLIPYALRLLSTSEVAIFLSSIPLFVLVLARIFLKETISIKKWMGFVLGMLGLVLLSTSSNSISNNNYQILPYFLCIFASILLAGGGIVIQIMPKTSPISLTAAAFLIGGICVFPSLVLTYPDKISSMKSLYGLLAVGFFSTFIGSLTRFILIRRAGAVFTSINGYLAPIITCTLGIIVLNENLTFHILISFMIIISGIFIAQDLDKTLFKFLFKT